MATVRSIASGNWNADAATVWDSGSVPAAVDDVEIWTGHVVTKDTAIQSPDCASLTVYGTGELALGSNGIHVNGVIASDASGGPAKISGGDNCHIKAAGQTPANTDLVLQIEASSGNEATLEATGTADPTFRFHGSQLCSAPSYLKFVNVIRTGGVSGADDLIEIRGFDFILDAIEDCDFGGGTVPSDSACMTVSQTVMFKRCFFHGCDYGLRPANNINYIHLLDCTFGKDRDGTSDANTNDLFGTSANMVFFCPGTRFLSPILWARTSTTVLIFHQGTDDPGGFGFQSNRDQWERSTAAKKSGDYGIHYWLLTTTDTDEARVPLDIAIPVESGDDLSDLAIWYQINSPSTAFSGSGDDIVIELDPGNEWGLYEKATVDYTEDTWNQIEFTGGAAGGSGAKGSLLIRFWLHKYVATTSLFIADPSGLPRSLNDTLDFGSMRGVMSAKVGGGGVPVVGGGIVRGGV